MRFYLSCFILCIVGPDGCFCRNKQVRDMLVSYVLSEGRPTHLLTPGLCWNSYEQTALTKSLNSVKMSAARSLQPSRALHQLVSMLVLVDMACNSSTDLLTAASSQGKFKSPHRWLLLDFPGIGPNDVLDALDILVDSDVVTAHSGPAGDAYFFTEGMKVKSTFSSEFGVMADYRATRALSPRRMDLRGHVLTMANVIVDSNDTRKHLGDRLKLHQDSITKISYLVSSICFSLLNASERLLFTHTWGYKNKNGSWNGVIDHLLKKEVDMGTQMLFTQERAEVIDFIATVESTALRMVLRAPPLAYLSNIFTQPFSRAVWVAVAVCVLACAGFLYVTSKWEASMGMHPQQLDGSWADVLIVIISAVLQQGSTLEPRYAAGRCVTLLLFVALTILYAAFSANIVVLLRAPSASVRTLNDLFNSPIKIGASDFEYNRYFLKKLNEPLRKEIYDKKIAPKGKPPNFYTMEDGVERIRKGLFAFHMELNTGYRLIQQTYQENEKCDLLEIDYINEMDAWVPAQKNSPFKDLFRISFIKIRESGVQSCVHRRLQVPRPRCAGAVPSFSSVGLLDVLPAVRAALLMLLLAPIVLLLEVLYCRLAKIRQRNRKIEEN